MQKEQKNPTITHEEINKTIKKRRRGVEGKRSLDEMEAGKR